MIAVQNNHDTTTIAQNNARVGQAMAEK